MAKKRYPRPLSLLAHALVAQLDRVSVSEAEGRWFDSSRARHIGERLGIIAIEAVAKHRLRKIN